MATPTIFAAAVFYCASTVASAPTCKVQWIELPDLGTQEQCLDAAMPFIQHLAKGKVVDHGVATDHPAVVLGVTCHTMASLMQTNS